MIKSFSSSLIPSLLLILSLATTLALDTTLQGNYFYVSSQNYLSYELDQTRNGIIAFSIEAVNQTYISQYVLIDLPNKDARPILTDIVHACELVAPTYQFLHYHVQTDTLAYFCYGNNSLLLIDQSSYTVEKVIPFNISFGFPVTKISTEGMGIAVLLMDDLFQASPKATLLVKVDMQTRAVTAEILLNQGFGVGEAVVAYASGKKGAYIATNRIEGKNLATTIYSIKTIGKQYQMTPISSFSASMTPVKVVTKLFCLGSYVAVNNGQDLYFINQQGDIATQVKQIYFKSLTNNQAGLFHLAITAQPGSTDLYLQMGIESVYKYSVLVDGSLHFTQLGGWGDIQIAYGNSTSGDLMFTLDYLGVNFTVYDVKTMKPVYSTVSGYANLMLTNTTYAIVQSHDFVDYNLYIFDLKTDALISKIPVGQTFYYTKEQRIISYFVDNVGEGCSLQHIDLTNGKSWFTLNVTGTSMICDSFLTKLRLTENGNPEFIMPILEEFMIVTEAYGQINFKPSASPTFNDLTAVNIDFDSLTLYYLDSDGYQNTTEVKSYAFNPQTKKFESHDVNLIWNVSATCFAFVNTTQSLIINNNTVAVINGVGRNPEVHVFPQDWNYASAFQDLSGNEYIILTKSDMLFVRGASPALLFSGDIAALPGMRKDSVRAEATGVNSYFISDELYESFGLVRFYKAVGSSTRDEGKVMISI